MNRLFAALYPGARHTAQTTRAARSPALEAADDAAASSVDDAPPELPGACGWFDSSHALQHGLRVTEHSSADAVAADLPLADWLQLHLGGWVVPRAGETPLQAGCAAR